MRIGKLGLGLLLSGALGLAGCEKPDHYQENMAYITTNGEPLDSDRVVAAGKYTYQLEAAQRTRDLIEFGREKDSLIKVINSRFSLPEFKANYQEGYDVGVKQGLDSARKLKKLARKLAKTK